MKYVSKWVLDSFIILVQIMNTLSVTECRVSFSWPAVSCTFVTFYFIITIIFFVARIIKPHHAFDELHYRTCCRVNLRGLSAIEQCRFQHCNLYDLDCIFISLNKTWRLHRKFMSLLNIAATNLIHQFKLNYDDINQFRVCVHEDNWLSTCKNCLLLNVDDEKVTNRFPKVIIDH